MGNRLGRARAKASQKASGVAQPAGGAVADHWKPSVAPHPVAIAATGVVTSGFGFQQAGRRLPVAYVQEDLGQEVWAWLQAADEFNLAEGELLDAGSGFERCVDYPQLPGHTYYEGYFHASPSSSPSPGLAPGPSGTSPGRAAEACKAEAEAEKTARHARADGPAAPERSGTATLSAGVQAGPRGGGAPPPAPPPRASAALPFRSVHPRKGMAYDKPAASRRLACFVESVRRANNGPLIKALEAHGAVAEEHTPLGTTGSTTALMRRLVALLRQGRGFADCAVQFHYGDAVEGGDLGWHVDGINSLLHLALSIRGTRGLNAMVADSPSASCTPSHHEALQTPGRVYLSSPYAMQHAVRYPATAGYSNRIIAVQCRLLLTADEMHELQELFAEGGGSACGVACCTAIKQAIEQVGLVLPSMEQVLAVEKEWPLPAADEHTQFDIEAGCDF